ncbi:MAG TPA: hypothetical protein VFQ48_10765 [Pseudonocardiaceae bacterium]|nr:hypothetical protein [Pseudonocardiaceae bacterium]
MAWHFGPANVAAWSLGIAVEQGHGTAHAERLDAHPVHPTSAGRRSRLHLDLARGYAQAEGARDAEAIRHLDTADRIAPTRIRNDPLARDLVCVLDQRARRSVWELDSLRNRFGIGKAEFDTPPDAGSCRGSEPGRGGGAIDPFGPGRSSV